MQLIKEKKKGNYLRLWMKEIWPMLIKAFPLVLFFLGVLFLVPKGFYLLASPFFVLLIYPLVSGETSIQKSLSKGISYGSKDFWGTLVSFLLISVLAYVFSWLYYNPFLPGVDLKSLVIDEIIDWHTITVFEEFLLIKNFISAFLILIITHLLLPLVVAAVSFQYLSIHDKQNALGLKQRLKKFGKGNKHFETKL